MIKALTRPRYQPILDTVQEYVDVNGVEPVVPLAELTSASVDGDGDGDGDGNSNSDGNGSLEVEDY
jgi:hypothetical protein